tara:strand:+ start:426 stop:1061 length:636 start_codon:yes stop_codon:yes gene_type:complete
MPKLAHALAAAAGNAGGLTFEHFATVQTEGSSVTLPASLEDGDIGVLIISGISSQNTALAGWTTISTFNSTFDSYVGYKVLATSDSSTSQSFLGGNVSYDSTTLLVFRPSKVLTNVYVSDTSFNYTTGVSSVSAACTTYDPPNLVIAYSAAYPNPPAINEGYWTTATTPNNTNNQMFTYYIIDDENTTRSVTQSADYGSYNRTFITCINGD